MRARVGDVPRRARLVAEIAATYLRVRRLQRRSTLPETLTALRRPLDSPPRQPPVNRGDGIRLGQAVARTLRALRRDSRCLMQSLVLSDLLARRDTATTLVIGVRPGENFLAHAWVELDGAPLLPPMDDEFVRLTEL
ncbi:MAG TPA: lasso peptide biosynthesis B2 protein [Acidimicrobiales bacterium]|nr:lasso peptide biosynthesis B2 protein [Acidimicrobiales bacterium]